MSAFISNNPSNGTGCKVVTIGNPVVYYLQRADFTILSRSSSGGNWTFTVTGNVTASFAAGVKFVFVSGNSFTSLSLTVVSSVFTTTTLITASIDSPATSPAAGAGPPTGYLNLSSLLNYYFEIEIWGDFAGTPNLIFSAAQISPNKYGVGIVNVSPYLKPSVIIDVVDFFGIATIQTDGNSIPFFIKYREVWTGSANSQTSDVANIYLAVSAARQIPSGTNSATLKEYALHASGTPAKWLTLFTNPKMWTDQLFTLSFVLDSDFVLASPTFLVQFYLEDGTFTGSLSTSTSMTAPCVGLLDILTVWNNVSGGITMASIGVRKVVVTCTTGGNGLVPITINVIDTSYMQNIVNLCWRNSLGGFSYWCFDYSQDVSYKYTTAKNKRSILFSRMITQNEWDSIQECSTLGTVYQPPVIDMALATATQRRIGQQTSIITDGTGNVRIPIIVIPTEQTASSRRIRTSLQIVVEYPESLSPI